MLHDCTACTISFCKMARWFSERL